MNWRSPLNFFVHTKVMFSLLNLTSTNTTSSWTPSIKSCLNCEEAHSTIQTTADGRSKIHTSTRHFSVRQTNFTVSLRFLWKTCHHLSLCGQPGIFPCWLQAVAIGSQATGNLYRYWPPISENNGHQQLPSAP